MFGGVFRVFAVRVCFPVAIDKVYYRCSIPAQRRRHHPYATMSAVPPVVVILGSTGTGKTKLSLELAARYGGEVISADSMQVYTGLDIVTAKATQEEQQQVVHHLLSVVTPDQAFTVTHFRERALPIIDALLAANRMPIVVGGTNYYIESILWRVLLGASVKRERVRVRSATELPGDGTEPTVKQTKPDDGVASPVDQQQTTLERLLEELPTIGSGDALEVHGTELLHRVLQRVDPESADRLHPNNKRKIIRALEVYVESGGQRTMSEELAEQRAAPGSCDLGGPLRYRNVVILWLRCDQETLNHRLDERVDKMVAQGLLPEIRTFHETYVKPYDTCEYHRGILQSIGFKEFAKYLEHNGPEKDRELLDYLTTPPDVRGPKPAGLNQLEDCLDYLKLVTRRYARRQLQWIRNRFLCDTGREVPPIYALDTSDINRWKEQVSDTAVAIIEAATTGQSAPVACVPKIVCDQRARANQKDRTFRCESCQRVFIGEHQWQIHLRSKKHRKVAKHSTGERTHRDRPVEKEVEVE
ncbi:tRNA dimethylallyltransferase [Anopheles maculipalpis]|uniref:tRNA dimethylallyltransferase n=1 Tax=Anopheles maculipalpis TaxID=1496333 RepID=UPI0021597009|nr:tRNA dimethylallyltransferase [Anopheles maculipalpis]